MVIKPVKTMQPIVIDVVGAAMALCALSAGIWFGFLKEDRAASSIAQTRPRVESLEHRTQALKAQVGQVKAALERRTAERPDFELLPDRKPADSDFRRISQLAVTHGLVIGDFMPMSVVRYPGVEEHRFKLLLRGSFSSYTGFLRDFEHSSSWADVTQIKLGTSTQGGSDERFGEFTVSLYSGLRDKAGSTPPEKGERVGLLHRRGGLLGETPDGADGGRPSRADNRRDQST